MQDSFLLSDGPGISVLRHGVSQLDICTVSHEHEACPYIVLALRVCRTLTLVGSESSKAPSHCSTWLKSCFDSISILLLSMSGKLLQPQSIAG